MTRSRLRRPTAPSSPNRAAAAEMQATIQAELPFARARLERLIEARAIVLAEKMYEKRKRLDVEAVKAEMT